VPGRSFRFPDESAEIKSAPGLNENTFDVLAELGVSAAELEGLVSSGVLKRQSSEEQTSNAAAG
jgi:hypothetical protein